MTDELTTLKENRTKQVPPRKDEAPERTWRIEDFGLKENTGSSSVVVCGPFELFSKVEVAQMRRELLGQNIPDCETVVGKFGRYKKGMVPAYSPLFLPI